MNIKDKAKVVMETYVNSVQSKFIKYVVKEL